MILSTLQADVVKIKSIEKELARGSGGNRGTEGVSVEEVRDIPFIYVHFPHTCTCTYIHTYRRES